MASAPLISALDGNALRRHLKPVQAICPSRAAVQSVTTTPASWRAWRGRGQAGLSVLKGAAALVAGGGAWSLRWIFRRFGWWNEGLSGWWGAREFQEGRFVFGTGPGPPLLLAFSAAVAGATRAHSFGARLPAPAPEPKSRAKLRLARAVETQHPLSSLVQIGKTEEGTADQGHPLVRSGATSEQPFLPPEPPRRPLHRVLAQCGSCRE